jgi:protein phosphatase
VLGSAHGVVIDFAELSDPGLDPTKQINEDASGHAETALGHLAVVCDGMGGHSAGREASQTAVRTILESVRRASPETPPGVALERAIEEAGRAVYAVGGAAPAGLRPGSTCVALLVHARGAEIAHVGDSRAYRVRGNEIERLTRDHSLVQELVDSGSLSPEQAAQHPEANKITRALGIAPEVAVEARSEPLPLLRGDTLLLCSDGLTDLVTDQEIRDVVRRRLPSGTAMVCRELIALCNSRGGHDNSTVLVLSVVEMPLAATVLGGTLVQDHPTVDAPAPTLYDDRPGRTEPGVTQIDAGERHTQPDLSLSAPPFRHEEPPAFGQRARPASSSRVIVAFLIGVAVTILTAIGARMAVRALHGSHRRSSDEPVPLPAEVETRRHPHVGGSDASIRPRDGELDTRDPSYAGD